MISKELAESRAAVRIKKEPGHDFIVTWGEYVETSWAKYYEFEVRCECKKGFRQGATTQTGAIPASWVKAFNSHINEVRNSNATGEPILVGKIKKQRVTNEVWVWHKTNELPPQAARIKLWAPWTVVVKNTAGWRSYSGHQTMEAAIAAATTYMDKKANYHEVEYAYDKKIGVEAPVATIVNSTAQLVQRANEVSDNPVNLSALLVDIEVGIKQLQILIPVRDKVQERLSKSLDLGI